MLMYAGQPPERAGSVRFLASGTLVVTNALDGELRPSTPDEFVVTIDVVAVPPVRGTDRRGMTQEIPKTLTDGEHYSYFAMGPRPETFVPAEVSSQLDDWFVTAAPGPKRTWKRGTPYPVLVSPREAWEALSRGVLRTVRRGHEERNSAAHFPGWGMTQSLCYSPADGRFMGTAYDLSLGSPVDIGTLVRVPAHWDHRDVDWSAFRRDPATGRIGDAVRLPEDAA